MTWDNIKPDEWQTVDFISGKVATEIDVEEGRAVFHIPTGSEPYQIKLPQLANFNDEESNSVREVVVIQAEIVNGTIYIGYRDFNSGNGICTLAEIEFCK